MDKKEQAARQVVCALCKTDSQKTGTVHRIWRGMARYGTKSRYNG